jgi:hypothetical protein
MKEKVVLENTQTVGKQRTLTQAKLSMIDLAGSERASETNVILLSHCCLYNN